MKRTEVTKDKVAVVFVLQQYLPLAVLKRVYFKFWINHIWIVATVLTACGIETNDLAAQGRQEAQLQQYLPLAVLKPLSIAA